MFTKERNDYLSLENTNCLKGIFAIFIVICHSRNSMSSLNNTPLGMILTATGYLSVAMFFFISGYGIEYQYKNKKDEYLKGFLKKRFLSTYVIYAFSVIFYAVLRFILYNDISVLLFFKSFLFSKTVLPFGWYFQAILLVYILFYLFHSIFMAKRTVFYIISECIVYMAVVLIFTSGNLYLQSFLAFPLGCCFAYNKERFDEFCDKLKILSVIIFFVLFSLTLLAGNLKIFNSFLALIVKMFSSAFFVLFVLSVIRYIDINTFVTKKLGRISTEIYIMQGFSLVFLRSKYIFIKNDFLYLILNLAITIILAVCVHPFFAVLKKQLKS